MGSKKEKRLSTLVVDEKRKYKTKLNGINRVSIVACILSHRRDHRRTPRSLSSGGRQNSLSLEHSWSLKLPLASQTFTLGYIQASCVATRPSASQKFRGKSNFSPRFFFFLFFPFFFSLSRFSSFSRSSARPLPRVLFKQLPKVRIFTVQTYVYRIVFNRGILDSTRGAM